jgi:hypothetical protein
VSEQNPLVGDAVIGQEIADRLNRGEPDSPHQAPVTSTGGEEDDDLVQDDLRGLWRWLSDASPIRAEKAEMALRRFREMRSQLAPALQEREDVELLKRMVDVEQRARRAAESRADAAEREAAEGRRIIARLMELDAWWHVDQSVGDAEVSKRPQIQIEARQRLADFLYEHNIGSELAARSASEDTGKNG